MDADALIKAAGFGEEARALIDAESLEKLRGQTVVVKYGGNAMEDPALKRSLMQEIAFLRKAGAFPVIVHGGGPFIQKLLDEAGVRSDFHGGHRRTTEEAMKYVEMALKGEVNGGLVEDLSSHHVNAVGLSGKDARMVSAVQRYVEAKEDGGEKVDLGHVGDVDLVDPSLLRLLMKEGYLPVLAPIALGPGGKSYNVNADLFAGHIAGALEASVFLVLTDVDGLLKEKEDPDSLIPELSLDETEGLYGTTIQGGMIPKVDACTVALRQGAGAARIVNGTRQNVILKALLGQEASGTRIHPS
jgi:acetylglutamate kinase